MNAWTLAGVGLNIAVVFMIVIWLIARRINNASLGDVGWAWGFTLIVLVFAGCGPGDVTHRLVLAIIVTLWSLRLGTHLFIRMCRQGEAAHYRELREQFPKRQWRMFFGFFFLQALFLALMAAPFAVIATNPSPDFSRLEMVALALWMVGFLGETVADWQLARARRAGQVCQTGLWRFSRHPNHFCEFLMWVAYFGLALAIPGGWVMVFWPLLMLILLTRFTGAPPAEAAALREYGDAYRDYQARTSPFLPTLSRRP